MAPRLEIRAAAEAGRVVPVARVVGGRPVEAAGAVDRGVDVEAAAEGAVRIGGPFVEVAHQVPDAIVGGAGGVAAGRGQAVGELAEAGVADLAEDPGLAALEVL